MPDASSQIRFKDNLYDAYETIATGRTSIVYKTTAGPVIKQYRRGKSVEQLERDVFWLERLRGTGIAPELLDVDRSRRAVMMSDGGEPISPTNAPSDWETQLTELIDRLRARRCCHNDLSEQEVLVKDGRLCIVDFAFGQERGRDTGFPGNIPPIGNSDRKLRLFLDDHIVNYVRFRLFGAPTGAEPHCFVLWRAQAHEQIQNELSKNFEILRAILYMPEIVGRIGGNRDAFLNKFYSGRPGAHGDKARSPFVLYFALDKNPHYDMRTNPSRGTTATVNTNVFDLKHGLRKKRSAFLHGSDSIQECFDNLEAVTVFAEDVPKSYCAVWRPGFQSVSDFFKHLNDVDGLEYLVLRNFESLMENRVEQGADIDFLVNDFHLFKRFSGAMGYKHKRAQRPGPAHEYGGYKVAGLVDIGGQEVSVDIRYVGSHYYDEQWERDMLASRVRCEGFYIPDRDNLFYSLLYHALVHKRKVRARYRQILGEMAPAAMKRRTVGVADEELWNHLDEFMQLKRYKYVRPKELSIQLSAGAMARMGVSTDGDLRAAATFASRGLALEATDLLLGILVNEPDNKQAKRMLAALDRAARGSGVVPALVALAGKARLGRLLPEVVKRPIRSWI